MAKLKVTRVDGSVNEYKITPRIEYTFELHYKKGFHKAFRDDEMQSMVYFLCWECIRSSGETVKPFGPEFLDTIAKVDVLDDDPLE